MQPPLLPEAVFVRVVRLAKFDGWGVLLLTGSFALVSALAGDRVGAVIGLLVAGAGAIELHGEGLLRSGRGIGMNWLVASQLYLLAVIVAYCAWRLQHIDLEPLHAAVTEDLKVKLEEAGYTEDQFLQIFYRMLYGGVAVLTVLYQGGMAIYYARRSAAVQAALAQGADPEPGAE